MDHDKLFCGILKIRLVSIGPPPSVEKSLGPYPTMVEQSSGRKVPVVQAYTNGKYLGNFRVTFNDDGEVVEACGEPILLDGNIPEGISKGKRWMYNSVTVTARTNTSNRCRHVGTIGSMA